MNIAIRVDASNLIGTGHVMRCLTLAEALREMGANPRFICRFHDGNLIDQIRDRTMPVTVLPRGLTLKPRHSADYGSWLGVTQEQDAEDTIKSLANQAPDWLLVDHYGLCREWEQRLRTCSKRLMVIDDLANRNHDCDLLLDQNFATDAQTRYQGLVPGGCRKLLGPYYALLRPEYAAWRKTLQPRDGKVRRVLLFMGGSDPHNATGLALEVLAGLKFQHLQVDVVIGANNSHRSAIQSQVFKHLQVTLHEQRPHLADLMACADLAIGAGGTATWERLCLGLPALVISIADNQKPVCDALAKAGLIYYAGDLETLNEVQLHKHLNKMAKDSDVLRAMSEAGYLQVDGLGALRVLEALNPTSIEQLRLRPARAEDVTLYYNWANDPEVRLQAIHGDMIPWSQHRVWFSNKLSDTGSHLFVLEAKDLPVGQIRFDQDKGEACIDYSLDPLVRGRGWAAPLITMGARWLSKVKKVILRADVKANNFISQSVFRRLGFSESADSCQEGIRTFRLHPADFEKLFLAQRIY